MALTWQLLFNLAQSQRTDLHSWGICSLSLIEQKTKLAKNKHGPSSHSQSTRNHNGKQPEEKANIPKMAEQIS